MAEEKKSRSPLCRGMRLAWLAARKMAGEIRGAVDESGARDSFRQAWRDVEHAAIEAEHAVEEYLVS